MANPSITGSHESPSARSTPGRRILPSRVQLAGIAAGVLLAAGLVFAGFTLLSSPDSSPAVVVESTPAGPTPTIDPNIRAPIGLVRPVVSADGLIDKTGIKIVYVALTGGGGLLDLRFTVIDPDKAAAVHDDQTPPMIIDEATGLIVDNLLMGHSHEGSYNPGQTYYLIFENPGNIVQRGGLVSVMLGNTEIDNIMVQ